VGIEPVQVCTEELCLEFGKKQSYRILCEEKLCKEYIEQKNSRRMRSISCSRNPSSSEFDEISRTQGVHGRSKIFEEKKLGRSNAKSA
jgi:hypothetical protein